MQTFLEADPFRAYSHGPDRFSGEARRFGFVRIEAEPEADEQLPFQLAGFPVALLATGDGPPLHLGRGRRSFQDFGNTWSLVSSVRGKQPCTHRIGFCRGIFVVSAAARRML